MHIGIDGSNHIGDGRGATIFISRKNRETADLDEGGVGHEHLEGDHAVPSAGAPRARRPAPRAPWPMLSEQRIAAEGKPLFFPLNSRRSLGTG